MIFATFSVKPNLPQNRLQLGFTVSINSKIFSILRAITFIYYINSFYSHQLPSNLLQISVCLLYHI